MTLKNFLYQNCNISYRIYGQGKPLMLLHGFGENSSIWQKQADALKNNYLIITPDLPGSGKSAFGKRKCTNAGLCRHIKCNIATGKN